MRVNTPIVNGQTSHATTNGTSSDLEVLFISSHFDARAIPKFGVKYLVVILHNDVQKVS